MPSDLWYNILSNTSLTINEMQCTIVSMEATSYTEVKTMAQKKRVTLDLDWPTYELIKATAKAERRSVHQQFLLMLEKQAEKLIPVTSKA